MRIIITGGTGLIGQPLSRRLAQAGHHVFVLTRNLADSPPFPPGVELVEWDAKTAQGWGHLADGADAIINLAGASVADHRWTQSYKKLILDSRLNAAQAVIEAVQAAEKPPGVVIQSSAVGYYGPRADETLTESSTPGDDFLAYVCLKWENAIKPVQQMGIRCPILRTGIVLSAEGGALGKMLPAFKLFVGGPLGNGKQWFPWIHLEDEVRAIEFLLTHPHADGPFNLTSPNPLTNAEFSRTLGRVLNRPAVFPVPKLGLQTLFGELAETLLTGQRALPKALLDLGFHFNYPTATAALEDLLT